MVRGTTDPSEGQEVYARVNLTCFDVVLRRRSVRHEAHVAWRLAGGEDGAWNHEIGV